MSYAIYHDLAINAPANKVFEAISQPKHLVNWWPFTCEGEPHVGATYNFYFTEEYDWYGEVTRCIPNTTFHIKMTQSDADWDPTSFGFDLKENQANTQVEFWHVGWPSCNAHYKRSSYCWAILLKGLKDYIEKGVIVPFEERA